MNTTDIGSIITELCEQGAQAVQRRSRGGWKLKAA
jgi:hypothetical protein